jgi:hypothetical protein
MFFRGQINETANLLRTCGGDDGACGRVGARRGVARRFDIGSGGKTRRGRDALYPGLGPVHHAVSTTSPLAQKYFDQGLAFTYGFNHDEAVSSFEQAAQIDPKMAMAYWGIAVVSGPNYKLPRDPARGKEAHDAVARARALKPGASPKERALIDAVAERYGADGASSIASDQAYANAMRRVAHEYPDDFDVQTLFAESLMDLHGSGLWNLDGKPELTLAISDSKSDGRTPGGYGL